jgi:hypothetical protein
MDYGARQGTHSARVVHRVAQAQLEGTTLFASLNMLYGKVIGACVPRQRHQ